MFRYHNRDKTLHILNSLNKNPHEVIRLLRVRQTTTPLSYLVANVGEAKILLMRTYEYALHYPIPVYPLQEFGRCADEWRPRPRYEHLNLKP
jgi:hypothetical protein